MCISQTSVSITTQQDGGHQRAESVVRDTDAEARGTESKTARDSLVRSHLRLCVQALFRQKLELCCTMFDFDDPESDVRGKEMKRETLLELAEYVNSPSGQKIFTESLMPDIVKMVSTNLLRTLPPQTEDYDPEEDEPAMEVMWPHLQVVYEFFLRFIVSNEVNGKVAKRFVDQNFIKRWIELFDAEDPRERDYVKTVLHRMYGKFMSYRSSIRKIISQVFFRFIYETGR